MRLNWRRWMTMLAFAGCAAMLAPACVVRAQGRVKPRYVVSEEPPPPRYKKNVRQREGYVWIRGHWEWREGSWKWKSGHWERSRAKYDWQPGYWEKRGNRYHWVEGRWVDEGNVKVRDHRRGGDTGPKVRDHRKNEKVRARRGGDSGPKVRDHRDRPKHPTSPPPDPRYKDAGTRSGYVWIKGHYEWRNGRYVWENGHWERAKSGHEWKHGHWERRGDRYVWVEGRWKKAVKVRDHRDEKKKRDRGRKNEKVPARRGDR